MKYEFMESLGNGIRYSIFTTKKNKKKKFLAEEHHSWLYKTSYASTIKLSLESLKLNLTQGKLCLTGNNLRYLSLQRKVRNYTALVMYKIQRDVILEKLKVICP